MTSPTTKASSKRLRNNQYFVLLVVEDTEPQLVGPFDNETKRDNEAKRLRAADVDGENGVFWLDNEDGWLKTGAYSAGFLGGGEV